MFIIPKSFKNVASFPNKIFIQNSWELLKWVKPHKPQANIDFFPLSLSL